MNKPTSKLIALFFSACVLSGTVLLSSCSKDDDDPAVIDEEIEIPTEFTEFTPEQNKEKLEDNGITVVNKMTSLKNASGIKTAIAMSHFLEISAPENGRVSTNNKAVRLMLLLSKFGIGKVKASDVMRGLRTRQEEEPSSPQEVFNEYKGTYAWNNSTQLWVYTAGGDKIAFQFPSTKAGTTNNAEFAIYGYTSKQVVNVEAEYEEDVPTGLKADLTVSGTKVMQYSFTASYENNGEPTAVSTSLTIDAFKFSLEVENSSSVASATYALTENNKNIISFGVEANGNFNSSNIDGNQDAVGNIVTSGEAFFQVMDIRFAGDVNTKALFEAMEVAETAEQRAAAYNANVNFVVFYVEARKKIADTQFIITDVTPEPYTYCYDYNGDGVETGDECDTYYYEEEFALDMELVFADESIVDVSTYTEEGFTQLTNDLEQFVEDLENDIDG